MVGETGLKLKIKKRMNRLIEDKIINFKKQNLLNKIDEVIINLGQSFQQLEIINKNIMKKQELKQLIKEVLLSEDIKDYLTYSEHPAGDPAAAAQKIIELSERYIKQVEKALALAGPFLAPGIRNESYKDLKKQWENMRLPKTPRTLKKSNGDYEIK